MSTALFLPESAADRFQNMALDEAMWRWVAAGHADAIARLYGWSDAPVLSIGYFQEVHPGDPRLAAVAGRFVRRPTGGGAIRHEEQMTFALALRASGVPARSVAACLHGAVARELTRAGVPVQLGGPSGCADAFFCFHRPDPNALYCGGQRILGSALRRRGPVVLIHGVLHPTSWFDRTRAAQVLTAAVRTVWGGPMERSEPPGELLSLADRLAHERYRTRAWNYRRGRVARVESGACTG